MVRQRQQLNQWRRLSRQHGTSGFSIQANYAELFYSTGIPLPGRMAYLLPRNCMDTQFRISSLHITGLLPRSGSEAEDHACTTLDNSRQYYNSSAHPLPELQLVPMWQRKTIEQSYGILTAIGPQWQYHIKIQTGNTLVGLSAIELQIQSHTSASKSHLRQQRVDQKTYPSLASPWEQRSLIEDPAWP